MSQPRKSASKLHKKVYEILKGSVFFKHLVIKQEVWLKELVGDYQYNHYADFYIQDLSLVIEVMGQQHKKATRFSNETSHTIARDNLFKSKKRDKYKRTMLQGADYIYVDLWFDEEFSEENILKKIVESLNE